MEEIIKMLILKYSDKRSELRKVIRGDTVNMHSEKWNKAQFSLLNEVISDLRKVL